MYKYDGKRVALAVWGLFTFYGFATLTSSEYGIGDNVKGWLHVLLYSVTSGIILLIILAVIREKVDK